MIRERFNRVESVDPSPDDGILARGILSSSLRGYFYELFLWDSIESFANGTHSTPNDTMRGCCITYTSEDLEGNLSVSSCLGSIHFISGRWTLSTLAHEIQHAVLHRLRYLEPGPACVMDESSPTYDYSDEEVIAYEAGDWAEDLMAWLTAADPNTPYPPHLFNHN